MSAPFLTTRWSLVAAAGDVERAREALGELARIYWYPLYAHARRLGLDSHAAEDVVQSFFARLYATHDLARVSAETGRFRGFLRVALAHHVANHRAAARAEKRGGGRVALGVDIGEAEARYLGEAVGREEDPARTYDRAFARTLVARALGRVGDEYRATGRGPLYEALAVHLEGQGDGPAGSPAERAEERARAAAALGLDPGAFRVALHRLRQRLGEALRDEVRDTVRDPAETEDELRSLLRALVG